MTQVVVIGREADRAAGLRAHMDAVPGNPFHRRALAVDQLETADVAGPDDLVAPPQRQRAGFAERDIARRVARGPERAVLAPAPQSNLAVFDPGHVARHVGDHRMGVELRVVVAAGHVPERRRHQTVRLHPGPPPGRGIVAPGLKELPFHPVEGRAHRRVVRPHHRLAVV